MIVACSCLKDNKKVVTELLAAVSNSSSSICSFNIRILLVVAWKEPRFSVLCLIHFDLLRSDVTFNAVSTRNAYCQRFMEK